jgi:hypothetical protein
MRRPLALLALVLIAGCDRDEAPREAVSPPLPVESTALPGPYPIVAPPALTLPQPESEPPPIEIEAVGEPEVAAEPELKVRVKPPVARRKAPVEPSEEPLALPELDLSLPEDWVQAMEEGDAAERPLLPPLFAVPPQVPSLQISGRLIPWVEDDETVIDGAQLDFEFRR